MDRDYSQKLGVVIQGSNHSSKKLRQKDVKLEANLSYKDRPWKKTEESKERGIEKDSMEKERRERILKE